MIKVENVTKWYATRRGRKYALRDINLELKEGVNVGILGRNGAGKSTFIRILGGVDFPNEGSVTTQKSISPPFGVASGLSPVISGRDNAKFVCRIHGDNHEKMLKRIEFIKEFSELGDYFDLPLGSYSSGMRSRLSFAVSMAFDYDYYLIDELVSVGDQKFRAKAEAAFAEKRGKASMILVSHNMKLHEKESDVGIYLRDGHAYYFDDIKHAIDAYLKAEG